MIKEFKDIILNAQNDFEKIEKATEQANNLKELDILDRQIRSRLERFVSETDNFFNAVSKQHSSVRNILTKEAGDVTQALIKRYKELSK